VRNSAEYLVRELEDRIIAVYLFGSVARGDTDESSDIDVLIVHLGGKDFREKLAELTFEFMTKTGAPIEYISYSLFELKSRLKHSTFLREIVTKGEKLFMRDEEEVEKLECKALLNLSGEFEEDALMSRSRETPRSNRSGLQLTGTHSKSTPYPSVRRTVGVTRRSGGQTRRKVCEDR